MRRKTIVSVCIVNLIASALFVGILLSGDPVVSAAPITIRFGTVYPLGSPSMKAAEYFAKLVSDKSKDGMKVQVFPSEQLGTEEEMTHSVALGAIEMSMPGTGVAGRFQRQYMIFPVVFLFDNWDHLAKVIEGPIGKDMADTFLKVTGARVLASNWFREPRFLLGRRPVNKLEDLKGFRIRVPEQPIWIASWKRLGASPTPMALAETYTGLQQGTVDGSETTISFAYYNGYHRIAKNVMLSEHTLESNLCIINDAFFRRLSPEYQRVLEEAALEGGRYHQQLVKESVSETLRKMESEGSTIIKLDRDRWIKKADGLGLELEKFYGAGLYKKIRDLASN